MSHFCTQNLKCLLNCTPVRPLRRAARAHALAQHGQRQRDAHRCRRRVRGGRLHCRQANMSTIACWHMTGCSIISSGCLKHGAFSLPCRAKDPRNFALDWSSIQGHDSTDSMGILCDSWKIILGPKLIFLTGLAIFATAVARLVCRTCLGSAYHWVQTLILGPV